MAAKLWKTGTNNAFSTTLNGVINASAQSIELTSTMGLQAPGILVIDRVDSVNEQTPIAREYISFTGITENSITGVSRGLGGTNANSHASGSIVEEVFTIDHWNDLLTYLLFEHTSSGTHADITGNSVDVTGDVAGATAHIEGAIETGSAHATGNITTDADVDATGVVKQKGKELLPAGTIMAYGGGTAPDGWLLCDGTAYDRTDQSRLFAAIGTAYGSNNASDFKVPDLRDKFPIGKSATKALGVAGGSATVRIQVGAHAHGLGGHYHTLPDHAHGCAGSGDHNHGGSTGSDLQNWGASSKGQNNITNGPPAHYHDFGTSVNGSHGHIIYGSGAINVGGPSGGSDAGGAIDTSPNILNPYLPVNYIIKT